MFYCDPCGAERGWPTGLMPLASYGKCECCYAIGPCNDRPSSSLPFPKDAGPSSAEIDAAIESIKEAKK